MPADPYNLNRFVDAQRGDYTTALAELRAGKKRSHWMWYIFPQLDGLGFSSSSRRYGIKSLGEAHAYLAHPQLGPRLAECAQALLELQGRSASAIFGAPDDIKLRSSMTLFAAASEPGSPFERVLDQYFEGQRDPRTLAMLN